MSSQLEFGQTSDLSDLNGGPDLLDSKDPDLPRPLLWRLLVMPIKPPQMSKGGIAIASQVQDAQQYLNYCGVVVAMGGLCYTSARFVHWLRRGGAFGPLLDRLLGPARRTEPSVPRVGDHVIYGRYAGQGVVFKGTKLILVNDDEILAVVPDPSALKIYI